MLGYYRLSLIGLSHQATEGGVCQDASGVKVLPNGWVVGVIADGLGSAKCSQVGAKLAVETVLSFVEQYLPADWHIQSLTSLLCLSFHEALRAIRQEAAGTENPLNAYDTTLTAVIYNGLHAVYGHVGDGGIIGLSPFGEFSVLTKAQKGEAFNETYPLRSGPDCWQFGSSREELCALLMMTDGLFDVAVPWLLAKEEQKIYVNYVRRFMDNNLIGAYTEEDFAQLQEQIEEFLTGPATASITDDKTVVGILNTDEKPEVREQEYYAEPDWNGLMKAHNDLLYGHSQKADDGGEGAEPAADEPGAGEPEPEAEGQTAGEQTGKEPAAEGQITGATAGKPTVESQFAGRPTAQGQATGRIIVGKPASESQFTGKPTAQSQATGRIIVGKPAAESQTAGKPTAQSQATGRITAGKPASESQFAGRPTAQGQATGRVVTGKPASESQPAGKPKPEAGRDVKKTKGIWERIQEFWEGQE